MTDSHKEPNRVSGKELNSWRRGFTPQAEIWNGRMAIVGLILGVGFILVVNIYLSVK